MGEHEGLLTASSHVHLIRKKKTQPFHFFFHDSENYLLEKREKKAYFRLDNWQNDKK